MEGEGGGGGDFQLHTVGSPPYIFLKSLRREEEEEEEEEKKKKSNEDFLTAELQQQQQQQPRPLCLHRVGIWVEREEHNELHKSRILKIFCHTPCALRSLKSPIVKNEGQRKMKWKDKTAGGEMLVRGLSFSHMKPPESSSSSSSALGAELGTAARGHMTHAWESRFQDLGQGRFHKMPHKVEFQECDEKLETWGREGEITQSQKKQAHSIQSACKGCRGNVLSLPLELYIIIMNAIYITPFKTQLQAAAQV